MNRRDLLKYLGLAAGTQLGAALLRALSLDSPTTAAASASPGVFLNQLGYLPAQSKIATVRAVPPDVHTFRLRAAQGGQNGQPAFEAALTTPTTDALSGDTVRQADFSAFTQPGSYILEAGDAHSDPFTLGASVYADALRLTMLGYHGQRCGCAVDLGHGYKHPPCHLHGEYGPSSGRSGSLPNHGGWHDAGDYGRYIVNSGITCGTLLWAWELFPQSLRSLQFGITWPTPRHTPALPDFLEEVLWNLEWMLQLQDPDGGVFHKQTSDHFCAFILPQDDHLVSEVVGTGYSPWKSTCATADLAAVMAIAARCYAEFDPALAERFRTAAVKAWEWTIAHPSIAFHNPPDVTTGDYGDPYCGDEIAWASAELFRTTGDSRYEKAFLASLPSVPTAPPITVPSWPSVLSMACWTYAMTPGDSSLKQSIREATQQAAQPLLAHAATNGYGNTMTAADYNWGSNGVAGNQSLLLLMANHFQSGPKKISAALNNLHYLLGRNCFGVSWVTQLGTHPFQHPHHRPSAADGIAAPWPGLLSGGPNRHPGDAVAAKVPPAPPMRMWIDNQKAYSMNEIAINWNAPLVFLLAAANSLNT